MDFKQSVIGCVHAQIKAVFEQDIDMDSLSEWIEQPPDPAMGDFAVPCFKLSKALRMGPPVIAQKLAEAIKQPPEGFSRVECAGGYLNFFVDRASYAQAVLTDALSQGAKFGSDDEGDGRVITIDYSSINIMKRFHMGHLSSTMIGHSIRRVYEHLGYTVVGINHLGDWGTQFGKMICAYLRWGDKKTVEKGGIDAVTELYVKFHEEVENDPALDDEARMWFKKIEDGDPRAMEIFEWFKEMTLAYAQGVYELLGVTFDSYNGEAFYNDKMQPVVDELREKNLLKESDGAYIVDLEAYGMPPCLILKRDGATLYSTRDVAAALYRKKTYNFHKGVYVTAYQQDLHFRQWFKVIELMGYEWAKDLIHVPFGMVSFEGQALGTRKGHTVYLDDVLAQSIAKAREIIDEKSPDLENKDDVAKQVGVGATIFFDLSNSRIKDIDFWFDRALNFDGETGPYVQYTHARCCSVLRKAPENTASPDWNALTDEFSQAVVRLIAAFPQVIRESARRYEPSLITRHACDIAQAFNRFYFEQRILTEDAAATAARLALTEATRDSIKLGLYLIGIDAPERM